MPKRLAGAGKVLEPAHFAGVIGGPRRTCLPVAVAADPPNCCDPCEYEQLGDAGDDDMLWHAEPAEADRYR